MARVIEPEIRYAIPCDSVFEIAFIILGLAERASFNLRR
jgi:hypothetical protein